MDTLGELHNRFENLFLEIASGDNKNKVLVKLKECINIIDDIFLEINNEKNKNDFKFRIINENILNDLTEIKDKVTLKFEIKLELNKLINKILTQEYFPYIFEINEKIPLLINSFFSIIQKIKGVLLFDIIIRKMHLYLEYILNICPYKKLLLELKKGFIIPVSLNYVIYQKKIEGILKLLSSNDAENKEKGVDILIEYFNKISLLEKYDFFIKYAGDILVNLFKNISYDYSISYLKIGYILINLLIPNNFIMTANFNSNDNNKNLNYIYNDYLIDNLEDFFILLPYKNYEFYFQKDIIYLIEKIVDICITFLTVIIKFDENFELQYISYIILKRIYFIFPKYRKEINEYIPNVLNKLCQTKDQKQWNIAIGSRQFAYYLLVNDKDLTTKIKSSTEISPIDVKIEPINLLNTELKFGFKNEILIDQGKYCEKIIEVLYDNSLIFLDFYLDNELVGKDIELKFLKFDSGKSVWYYIFQERGSSEKNNKYIIYSRETGLYKIIFDNVFSWITKKKIFYQITLFKPIIDN